MLRITIAQLNLTVGDIEGNVARMVAAARQAAHEQSDLIVFSELALCGYYPADMLDEPPFLQRVQDGVAVGMAERAGRVGELDATEDARAAGLEAVQVETEADADVHR